MDKFAISVSIWNAVGYCLAVGIPTLIDPLLQHHVMYGPRTYPLGLWIFAPSVLVIASAYWINTRNWSAILCSVLTLGSLLAVTYATIPNFAPEFPHPNLLLVPVFFGAVTGIGSYIHHFQLDIQFVSESSLDPKVKLERLKMEHEIWLRLLVILLSVYALVAIYIYLSLRQFSENVTTSVSEVNLLSQAFGIMLVFNVFAFATNPLWELVRKTSEIRRRVTDIH